MTQSKIRLYVACPWKQRNLARDTSATLEAKGYDITHKWWVFEGEKEDTTKEFRQLCAKKDMDGVRTAHAMVLLDTQPSEGKAIEQGLALAYGIPIVAIGKPKGVFQYLPKYYWVWDIYKAMDVLEILFHEEVR